MTESLFKAQPVAIKDAIEYASDSVVSKMIIKKETGNLTLFAFDKGQSLSEHTAPFDAAVQILDGTAEIIIGGESHILSAGEFIVMPADIPHAVKANEKFKMLLTMIKEKKT
jgi:quercetin dioxygenase-like cupin family protein